VRRFDVQKRAVKKSGAKAPRVAAKARRGRARMVPGTVPTRERILRAAISEFAEQGYRGGRVERIAKQASANLRMIYHYFGGKEDLYVATLEHVFVEMRGADQQPELSKLPPVEAMQKFIGYTFDHLSSHREFVGLTLSENQLGARYLDRSKLVRSMTPSLLAVIRDLLERGRVARVFRSDVDPVQLFVTLQALCYLHIANRHTLSVIFEADLSAPKWLAERRQHVCDVLMAYLQGSPAAGDELPQGAAKKVLRRI
jgi:TetR/AcrR family transcriptional regulator